MFGNNNIKYIIISPVRNEAKNIERTIKAVISQTIKPLRWVIVDDGSEDLTPMIVERYTSQNSWMQLLRLPDRGYYDLMEGGEIKAFLRGYGTISGLDYEYLVKLDGDISFGETYFEDLFTEFSKNRKLGIASGFCYFYEGEKLIGERCFKKHVRGAARVYRKECLEKIGEPIANLGWDAIDVYKARMFGWETSSFEKIKMIHHVKTWTKGGIIHGKIRAGRMEYLMGTHPLFLTAKIVREVFRRPFLIGCVALTLGYLRSFLKKEKHVVDPKLMCYIRREQLDRIRPKPLSIALGKIHKPME